MSNGNWIKLNRKILKWEWYSDNSTRSVFLHALLKANYEPSRYKGHELAIGDVIFGRKKWAEELGLSEQQVRTAIAHLKETGELSTIKATNKFTILHVENWEFYQSKEDEATNNMTNEQPTTNQQLTNNQPRTKKEKKEKKEKKDKNNTPLTPQGEIERMVNELPLELRGLVFDFMDCRKKMKKPFTVRALGMMLKKLNELSGGDTQKSKAIIEQSIINGWTGIFALDEKKSKPRNEALEMLKRGVFDDEEGNIADTNVFEGGFPKWG